jgi:hypothetical protein
MLCPNLCVKASCQVHRFQDGDILPRILTKALMHKSVLWGCAIISELTTPLLVNHHIHSK